MSDCGSEAGDNSHRRGPIEAEIQPPGPKYKLAPLTGAIDHCFTKKEYPSYSIGAPYQREKNTNPGAYSYEDILTNRGMQKRPAYSLQSRPAAKAPYVNPAPGDYNVDAVKQGVSSNESKPLSKSFGDLKARRDFKNWAPPATKYSPNHAAVLKSSRNWSMYDRKDYNSPYYDGCHVKKNHPGPSAYGVVDKSVYGRKSAHYSMNARTQFPNYNTALKNPGPASYNPALPKSQKSVPLGIRHSSYVMPLITCADII